MITIEFNAENEITSIDAEDGLSAAELQQLSELHEADPGWLLSPADRHSDLPTSVTITSDEINEDADESSNATDITIDRPDWEEIINLEIEGVPGTILGDAAVKLDYFYGRPCLYIWEPDYEDCRYKIALPIEEDPQTQLIIQDGHVRKDMDTLPIMDELASEVERLSQPTAQ